METKFSSEMIKKIQAYVEDQFDNKVIPSLMDFIKIPNTSRDFDPKFLTDDLLKQAAEHMVAWVKDQKVKGLKADLYQEPGKTPLIFIEVEPTRPTSDTVLLYGHFDKQPPLKGEWRAGLGPTTPVIQDGKLYGRGAADDGYALYVCVSAIKASQELGMGHPRCVIIIESDEESGSFDLPFYFSFLKDRIGTPNLVICMDSGCCNYDQLWLTTSLRGCILMDVNVKIMTESVHSGEASGIVPDPSRIMRQLIARVENVETGEMAKELQVDIREQLEQAEHVVKAVGKDLIANLPWVPTGRPVSEDYLTCYLNNSWRPTLVVVGEEGLPALKDAGNLLRPEITKRFSIRLPPTLDAEKAKEFLENAFKKDPPCGAEVTVVCNPGSYENGWSAPASKKYLEILLEQASQNFFGKEALYFGVGGTIGLMNLIAKKFETAQVVCTGILGPQSNAHAPNECLDIAFTKKFLCCMIQVISQITEHNNL